MKRGASIGEEREALIAAALEKCQSELSTISKDRQVHLRNSERVIDICHECLSLNPVREPIAAVVSELGKRAFGKFPEPQSLLNRYSSLLRIWRRAFLDLVSLTAPRSPTSQQAVDLGNFRNMDRGAQAQFLFLTQVCDSLKLENARLKQLITQSLSYKGMEQDPSDPEVVLSHLADAQKWLTEVERGSKALELTEAGVKLTRDARIGRVVIPRNVIDYLTKKIRGSTG